MPFANIGKYRLLVVDDDKDNAELIIRTGLRCGYEAFPVYTAKGLQDVVAHWRPHLITIDLGLPDAEGYEFLSALKSVQFAGEIIIISGQQEAFRHRAAKFAELLGLRVTGNMEKPIQVAELRDMLTTIKASLFLSLLQTRPEKTPSVDTQSNRVVGK